jgi:hypothetical protein
MKYFNHIFNVSFERTLVRRLVRINFSTYCVTFAQLHDVLLRCNSVVFKTIHCVERGCITQKISCDVITSQNSESIKNHYQAVK